MGMVEKIRILLVKRGNISEAELARRLGMSTTNLYNRMKRDNFTDKDLQKIANVLGCTFEGTFKLTDTGEEI
ncbi:helix-turn-helix domain-containing protein [Leadbettera azotonutricia]|uniref:Conserved domain protein n=1 Tax=Leadbettera azotonutricia (strain ATCC BAA-888 / DSM 13862 / ZAS-9) TaxID=545695 RepID=F5YBH3_LEAAZ|nr:helix-turn-helix transcriptional regulator [Leadbettera azotonutricia]AEF83424.1 conserved domain protein [Leadbettera azotonutricia ZAS-9]